MNLIKRSLLQNLEYKSFKLPIVLSLIYTLLFNSIIFYYKFLYYHTTTINALLELSKDAIYILFFTAIIFFGLYINKILFILGSVFLFFTGGISSYYLLHFKIAPTEEVITTFFTSNFYELNELISVRLIVWLIFSLFICLYSIRYYSYITTKLFVTKLLSTSCLFILINAIIFPQFKLLKSYFPIQYLHNSYLYFFHKTMKGKKHENISKKFSFIDNSDNNIKVILIIGESARYDHFGINGYYRDTTPLLEKLENIFSFKAKSASNHTFASVLSLMSRHSSVNLKKSLNESTFLSILTSLGFDTNWIGTQTLVKYFRNNKITSIYDEVKFVMLPGGSTLLKMNDLDGKILPYVKNVLTLNQGKQMIVIHTSGSHWNYSSRYSKEFKKFFPGCDEGIVKVDQSTCNIDYLVNDYDNSILYTDFFLFSVISLLQDSNAFMIYVSDHGESLGEDGYYGHGGLKVKEQMTVPLIVWFSNTFKDLHPELVNTIKSHLANKEISHDYIFHSVLDCIGITSNVIKRELSICSKKSII